MDGLSVAMIGYIIVVLCGVAAVIGYFRSL